MALSASTAERLRRAGWSPGRSVDVGTTVDHLVNSGYEVGTAVVTFLQSYSLLAVSYPNFRDPTQPDGCHFDALRAANNVFRASVDAWERRVGTQLVPVGEAFDQHMTLLMAVDGRVFGGYDDFLALIGEDGDNAIDALCSGRAIGEALP